MARGNSLASSRRSRGWLCCCLFIVAVVVVVAVTVTQLRGDDGDPLIQIPGSPPAAPSPTAAPTVSDGIQRCNGLANLCGMPVSDVVFATVHNAMSTSQDGVFVLPNHELSLEAALEAGYRGINFDIGKCNGELRLVHGMCALGSRDPVEVMRNINYFLDKRPNEVLLLPAQIDNDAGGEVTLEEIDVAFQQVSGLKDRMYSHPGPGVPWPTLLELIQADTRILFFHYNGQTCSEVACPGGFHDWFTYAAETEFSFDDVSALEDHTTSCKITRGEGGQRDFFGINLFTKIPSNSACDALNTLDFLETHAQECSDINDGLDVNLVLVDCWDRGDVLRFVRMINEGLEPPPTTAVQADLQMRLDSVNSEMDAYAEVVFERECAEFFAANLDENEVTNVQCAMLSQRLVVSGNRRTRRLQTGVLEVDVLVSGDSATSGNSNSPEAFGSDLLQSILGSSGDQLVQSLAQEDSFFSAVQTVTADEQQESVSTAMPTVSPRSIPVTADPTISTTTIQPTEILVTAAPTGTATTGAPTRFPTAVSLTDEPTPGSSTAQPTKSASEETLVPSITVTGSPTVALSAGSDSTVTPSSLLMTTLLPTASVTTGGMTAAPTAQTTVPETVPPTAAETPVATTDQTGSELMCNGLSNLCDVPVDEVLFATVHNAQASAADNFILPNNQLSMEAALVAGYRGLNFDIGKCNGEIALVHSFCSVGTKDHRTTWENINQFLEENPNEVLLLPVQIDYGAGGQVTLEEINAEMESISGLKNRMYAHPGPGTPWPTLRELIKADERILFFHYNGQTCSEVTCPTGFHDWFTYAAETEFSFDDVSALEDRTTSCEITRGQDGQRDFFGINVFTRIPSEVTCAVLNTAEFLEIHMEECSALNGGFKPNLILVDCWDEGDLLSIVRQYNEAL